MTAVSQSATQTESRVTARAGRRRFTVDCKTAMVEDGGALSRRQRVEQSVWPLMFLVVLLSGVIMFAFMHGLIESAWKLRVSLVLLMAPVSDFGGTHRLPLRRREEA